MTTGGKASVAKMAASYTVGAIRVVSASEPDTDVSEPELADSFSSIRRVFGFNLRPLKFQFVKL